MKEWTPDELVKFRRLFGSMTNPALALRFKRSQKAIRAKAAELALGKDKRTFAGNKMPRWTKAELMRLRLLYPAHSNIWLAGEFGRSAKSIASKAANMKLRKTRGRLEDMGRANVSLRRQRTK